ncbi:MAG: hypothetical protein ACKPBH_19255, partial [Dolichospermum sp.]
VILATKANQSSFQPHGVVFADKSKQNFLLAYFIGSIMTAGFHCMEIQGNLQFYYPEPIF